MEKIKNVSPLGDLTVLLLGRDVAAGEVVEVSNEHAKLLVKQGSFEAVETTGKGE